jgi:hypothetical protein
MDMADNLSSRASIYQVDNIAVLCRTIKCRLVAHKRGLDDGYLGEGFD